MFPTYTPFEKWRPKMFYPLDHKEDCQIPMTQQTYTVPYLGTPRVLSAASLRTSCCFGKFE